MREILFRGKRKDNGEWVQSGSLTRHLLNGKNHYQIGASSFANITFDKHNNVLAIETEKDPLTYEVIPKTIGQYTGLTDKNGTKIFEGDIVRYKTVYKFSDDEDLEEYGNNNPMETECCTDVVKWYEKGCCFSPIPKRYDCEDYYYSHGTYDFEIIGNIHDTPELLKRSNNNAE